MVAPLADGNRRLSGRAKTEGPPDASPKQTDRRLGGHTDATLRPPPCARQAGG